MQKRLLFLILCKRSERYGVAEFDKNGKVLSIEEKPANQNHYAVLVYIFIPKVLMLQNIKPSARELYR